MYPHAEDALAACAMNVLFKLNMGAHFYTVRNVDDGCALDVGVRLTLAKLKALM